MAKTNTKQQTLNTFTGGMVTDTQPLITPNNILTDCLNGTLITHNGNEYTLQNDLGNVDTGASLTEGFIPLGVKEYNGILYIVSYNPETHHTEIGSYPSPSKIGFSDISNKSILDINLSKTSYTYEELKSFEKFSIEVLSADQYFGIVKPSLPDFFNISYLRKTQGFIIPIDKTYISESELNVTTSNYIKGLKGDRITTTLSVNEFDNNTSFKLYKTGSDLNVFVYLSATPSLVLSDSKVNAKITLGTESKTVELELIDGVYTSTEKITTQFPESNNIDIQIDYLLETTFADEVFTITYPFVENLDLTNIADKNIYVFDQYYYYTINENNINVTFSVIDVTNTITNAITFSLDDFNGNTKTFTAVRSHDDVFECVIPYDSFVKKDYIYLLTVNIPEEVGTDDTFARLLIVNDSFNRFSTTVGDELDFGKITGDEWISGLSFDEVQANASTDSTTYSLISNSSIDNRSYVTGLRYDNVVNQVPGSHNKFKACYMPYISQSADTSNISPSLALQESVNVKIADTSPITKDGIWSQYYGDLEVYNGDELIVDNTVSLHNTVGYKSDVSLISGSIDVAKRTYLESTPEFVTIKFTKTDEQTSSGEIIPKYYCEYTALDYDGETEYYIHRIKRPEDSVVLQTFETSLLFNAVFEHSNNDCALITYDSNLLFDWKDEDVKTFFDGNGDNFGTSSLLYNKLWPNNHKNKLFVPIHFILDNQLNIKIGSDRYSNSTDYYGILCVTYSENRYKGTLVKFNNTHLLTTNENDILEFVKFWNMHLYSISKINSLDVYKLRFSELTKFENIDSRSQLSLQGKFKLNRISFNGKDVYNTLSDELKTNVTFNDTYVTYPITVDLTNQLQTVSLDKEAILSDIKTELSEFVSYMNTKQITTEFDLDNTVLSDLDDILYNGDYTTHSISDQPCFKYNNQELYANFVNDSNAVYLIDSSTRKAVIGDDFTFSYGTNNSLIYSATDQSLDYQSLYKRLDYDEYLKLFNYAVE